MEPLLPQQNNELEVLSIELIAKASELKKDFSTNNKNRPLQLEAIAHIKVSKNI
ncbi:MAG: hypothetical protein SGJ00_15115 [bacterium]|nr:hypothetical protein [bacterium]